MYQNGGQMKRQQVIDLWYVTRLNEQEISRRVKLPVESIKAIIAGEHSINVRRPTHLPHWRTGSKLPL